MQYNKNADNHLFLQLFTKGQLEKNIEKMLFVSSDALKRWKTAGSGSTLPQHLPNPKCISSKIFISIKYICLTSNWQ